jgi:hypothetical protein
VLFDLPSGASIIVAMGVLAGAAWAFDGARRRTAPAA